MKCEECDLVKQYKWERDVAISQLKELGIEFGEKIDGYYIRNKTIDEWNNISCTSFRFTPEQLKEIEKCYFN